MNARFIYVAKLDLKRIFRTTKKSKNETYSRQTKN
ncbi:hypothetical protein VEx25_B0119 [Vibrio antiquarius]|uniref:Uncharacterized protein n=1 Tax=Vibrio antiquarius (strain Ex25) TaxID=150340 RepID=A0ABM9WXC1_VIBAE|nr:hypothetical protein VEx25_B0119 [Vibrio antiquarius]